jgi:hypothetical protein
MLGREVPIYQKNILSQSSGYNIDDSNFSEMFGVIYQTAWHHIPEDCAVVTDMPSHGTL